MCVYSMCVFTNMHTQSHTHTHIAEITVWKYCDAVCPESSLLCFLGAHSFLLNSSVSCPLICWGKTRLISCSLLGGQSDSSMLEIDFNIETYPAIVIICIILSRFEVSYTISCTLRICKYALSKGGQKSVSILNKMMGTYMQNPM